MPTFESVLADFGLLAVVVGTFFEGETIVIIAGFLAHEGYFNPYLLCLCAFIGSFSGDQLWFYVGRRHSDLKIVRKMSTLETFGKAIRLIERHPIKFIMTFRFVYGVRNIAPVALGLSSISALKYFVFNAIAAFLWAVSFTVIGYLFGQAAEAFIGEIAGAQQKILGAAVAGFAIYVLFKFASKYWAKRSAPGNASGD